MDKIIWNKRKSSCKTNLHEARREKVCVQVTGRMVVILRYKKHFFLWPPKVVRNSNVWLNVWSQTLYLSYNVHIVQMCPQLCKERKLQSNVASELCKAFNQVHKTYHAFLQLCSCSWVSRRQRDSVFCLVILRHVINLLLFTGYTSAPMTVNWAPLRSVTNKQNGLAV